jgi:two-component system, OmpR family, sensor kinase
VIGGRHRRRHRGRLFWRVWLNGLLLLAAAHLALAAVGWASGAGAAPVRPERIASLAARLLDRDLDDPARLAATLAQAREGLGVKATVYRAGEIVASSAAPPLPPLPAR